MYNCTIQGNIYSLRKPLENVDTMLLQISHDVIPYYSTKLKFHIHYFGGFFFKINLLVIV